MAVAAIAIGVVACSSGDISRASPREIWCQRGWRDRKHPVTVEQRRYRPGDTHRLWVRINRIIKSCCPPSDPDDARYWQASRTPPCDPNGMAIQATTYKAGVLVCPRAGRKVCDASTASDGGGSGEMSWSGTADHFNVVLFLGERVSDDERDAFAAYLASMSVVTHA